LKSFSTDTIHSAFWLSFQPVVQVASASDAFVPSLVRSVCLDPRCPTLFGSNNWSEGITWTRAFAEFEMTRDSRKIPWRVSSKNKGVWTLTVSSTDENGVASEWNLDIDVENGFVPTRYSVSSTPPNGLSFLEHEVAVSWQEINQVRVPVRLSRKALPSPFSGREDQLVLELEWSDVNQPINAEAFHYTTFPLTPGTGVQNVSTREWQKAYPTIPVMPTLATPRRSLTLESPVVRLVAVNFVLIAGALTLWLFRKRRIEIRRRWKVTAAVTAVVALVCVLSLRTPKQEDARETTKGLSIDSWSSVKPTVEPGNRIDLGPLEAGDHTHREILITNADSTPVTITEIVADCPGVRLYLPSPTIHGGERVCAFLDCHFSSPQPLDHKVIAVRAIDAEGAEAFTVFAEVRFVSATH